MNSLGALLLIGFAAAVLGLPRRGALTGFVAGILFLTQALYIDVGGFNLFALRILEVAAFWRVMARRELSLQSLGLLDKTVLWFVLYTTVVYALRTRDGLTYRIGWAVDVTLCYLSFRGFIQSREDVKWLLKAMVVMLIPYAAIVAYDSVARNNLFALIGGRVGGAELLRDGRMRACGSFRHPSLLGTLGASFLPLYIGLAFDPSNRKVAGIGAAACLVIVWASNSGGPLSCALVAFVGWMLWPMRHHMRQVRWGIALMVLAMGLAMKAPIWYLIARLSSVTGGDGFHRSHLMNQAYVYLEKWWLAGMPIEETMDWFPYYIHSTGGADITNQFLSFGIAAGLGSMFLFILVLVRAFKTVGSAVNNAREVDDGKNPDGYLVWGTGVVLAVHVFNWFGINYFDQMYAVWYGQLAIVVACGSTVVANSSVPEQHSSGVPVRDIPYSCTTS